MLLTCYRCTSTGLRTSENDGGKGLKIGGDKVNSPEPVQQQGGNVNENAEEEEGDLVEVMGEVEEGREGEQQAKEDCILFIGDLARGITDEDLEKAFSTVGEVRHIHKY